MGDIVHNHITSLTGNVYVSKTVNDFLVFSLGEVMLQAMTSVSVLSTTVTSGKNRPLVQLWDLKARDSSSCLGTALPCL